MIKYKTSILNIHQLYISHWNCISQTKSSSVSTADHAPITRWSIGRFLVLVKKRLLIVANQNHHLILIIPCVEMKKNYTKNGGFHYLQAISLLTYQSVPKRSQNCENFCPTWHMDGERRTIGTWSANGYRRWNDMKRFRSVSLVPRFKE